MSITASDLSKFGGDGLVNAVQELARTLGVTCGAWVILHSTSGCRRQAAHTDYAARSRSYSVVIAIEPGTRLNIWPGSHKMVAALEQGTAPYYNLRPRPFPAATTGIVLDVPVGAAVVFRGDLVHCGAAYDAPNTRLHCYLDHPGERRVRDQTYLVSEHQFSPP